MRDQVPHPYKTTGRITVKWIVEENMWEHELDYTGSG
jgi:hypothetical protein